MKRLVTAIAMACCAAALAAPAQSSVERCEELAASANEPGIDPENAVLWPHMDLPAARNACEGALAVDQSKETQFRLARVLALQKEFKRSRDLALDSAKTGYRPSLALAGYFLMHGVGGPEDVWTGMSYVFRADAEGDSAAAFFIGNAFEFGVGGNKPDLEQAVIFYRKAIDRSDYDAMSRFAYLVLFKDVSADTPEAAVLLLERAAGKNYPYALYLLGAVHASGKGRPVDLARAADLYRQAAIAGSVDAKSGLAELHIGGVPSGLDDASALAYARQAAGAGAASGHHWLGHFLFKGVGTAIDQPGAVAEWELALKLGHLASALDLAEALINGQGVAVDTARARELLNQAKGVDPARANALLDQIGGGLSEEDKDKLDEFFDQKIAELDKDLAISLQRLCEAARKACDGRVCAKLDDGERVYATMDGHGWYVESGRRVAKSRIDQDYLKCF